MNDLSKPCRPWFPRELSIDSPADIPFALVELNGRLFQTLPGTLEYSSEPLAHHLRAVTPARFVLERRDSYELNRVRAEQDHLKG